MNTMRNIYLKSLGGGLLGVLARATFVYAAFFALAKHIS